MKVIKFGGTSIGEVHAIEQLFYIINDKKKQKDRYTIIVSAIGGITDNLVKCAQYAKKRNNKYYLILDEVESKHIKTVKELFPLFYGNDFILRIRKYINSLEKFYDSIYNVTYISKISLNKIMNFGELMSSYFVNEKLKNSGFHSNNWNDSRDLLVLDSKFEYLHINFKISYLKIKYYLITENAPYIVIPGFIASSTIIETTSLGRGGSDYSASLIASMIQTDIFEIWTDVNGVMTGHPKVIPKYYNLEKISYKEAIDFSNFGANIIYPPTIYPSMVKSITTLISNTFSPLEKGTLIFDKHKYIITGIAGMQKIDKQILIDYFLEEELCTITIVVNKIKNIPMFLYSMFSTLGKEIINLYGIGYIKKNISTIITKNFFLKSIKTLYYIFFEKTYKYINIFIVGLGKVGSKLIELLNQQKEYLIEELNIKIKVIAICNRKVMYFDLKGINLNNWKDNLKLGINMTLYNFIISLYNLKLKHRIFVDSTASKTIANIYDDILGKGIGIVTCNKIACASSYQEYKNIKSIAKCLKTPFFFETNIGAGLPIINTLYTFIQSGDKIKYIDAVLSGSLNFIFNKCKNIGILKNILIEAKKRGFTEPDIRIDLSGIDVIRKILILIRECGEYLEQENIKQISLLPKYSLKSYTRKNFYKNIISNEEIFIQQYKIAKEQKKVIRYVTKYKYGETSIRLEYIEYKHPFYFIDNKDNMIIYTTKRYTDQPVIIKGAGAGDEVTASGVFLDIIKASIYI